MPAVPRWVASRAAHAERLARRERLNCRYHRQHELGVALLAFLFLLAIGIGMLLAAVLVHDVWQAFS